MMAALSFALAYAGLTALCLSMQRHHRQAMNRAVTPMARTGLIVAGWLCLLASILPCFVVWDTGTGVVAWIGILSAAGYGLAFLLPYAPRTAVTLGGLAPVVAGATAVIGQS